jgi:hypothetical protein
MKTNDPQVIRNATEAVIKSLKDMGLTHGTTIVIGNTLPAARLFAEEIMLDNGVDRIAKLSQMRLNEARAFLFVLSILLGELESVTTAPESLPVCTPEVYHTAAYAVSRGIIAIGNRRPFITALTE